MKFFKMRLRSIKPPPKSIKGRKHVFIVHVCEKEGLVMLTNLKSSLRTLVFDND